MKSPKVLITGSAGFIGMNLARHLVQNNYEVIGVDNFKPSYGGDWSKKRSDFLVEEIGLKTFEIDLSDKSSLITLVDLCQDIEIVIHLAAWPGVRLSQEKPNQYSEANIVAFANILELVRIAKPKKFLFASSSSVYGDLGINGPVSEESALGNNLKSFYAVTKWANELLASHYQKITNVPTVALRFFTVFGEFGRPDMAYWTFLDKMLKSESINLYGHNGGRRNYSYIKDVVKIVTQLIETEIIGFEAVNVASGPSLETKTFLHQLASCIKVKPEINLVSRPSIDVEATWSDQEKITKLIGSVPSTPIEESVENFVRWFTLGPKL
jgi:UDP-glucuronate 4-epimerase